MEKLNLLFQVFTKKATFVLTLAFLFLASCESAVEPDSESALAPAVEVSNRWYTSPEIPTNNAEKFKITLRITNTTIQLLPQESYCIQENDERFTIVDSITAERVFHSGVISIDLTLPDEFTDGFAGELNDCQIAWKEINDPADDFTVIELADFHYDRVIPVISLENIPTTALSPIQIEDEASYLRILAQNKTITVLNNGKESCLALYDAKINILYQGSFSPKLKIDAKDIDPTQDIGMGRGAKSCIVKAVDAAGNQAAQNFTVAVRKPNFTATLDKNPYEYAYDASRTDSGKAKLMIEAEADGTITCLTSAGVTCINGAWDVTAGTHEKVLDNMAIGEDNYTIKYIPKGYLPNSGWDTQILFRNVNYTADINFNVALDFSDFDGNQVNVFHNPAKLIVTSDFAGVVSFSSSSPTKQCPPYPDITVTANSEVTVTNVDQDGKYLGDYPVGTDVEPVPNITIGCRATLTISSSGSLNGSKGYSSVGYTLDRQKPVIEVIGDPFNINIAEAKGYAITITSSEDAAIVSNTCDPDSTSTAIFKGENRLAMDYSTLTESSCTIKIRDSVIDVPSLHEANASYNFTIRKAIFRYIDPKFTSSLLVQGQFESWANGILLCSGPIGNPDIEATNCFENPYENIPKRTASNPSTLLFLKLMQGKHTYKFTLIPTPPYSFSTADNIDEYEHRTEITEEIEAIERDIIFKFIRLNGNSRFGKNITWETQKISSDTNGSVSMSPLPGKVCPFAGDTTFDIVANQEYELEVNLLDAAKFPDNQDTAIGCTLTLNTDEGKTASITVDDKIVDKTIPTITWPPTATLNALSAQNYTAIFGSSEIANLSSPSGCGNDSLDSGSNTVLIQVLSTNILPTDEDRQKVYTCSFIVTDAVGNQTTIQNIIFNVAKPIFTITPDTSTTPIETSVPTAKLSVYSDTKGTVSCNNGGNEKGTTSLDGSTTRELLLSNLVNGDQDYICSFTPEGITGFAVSETVNIIYNSSLDLVVNAPIGTFYGNQTPPISVIPSRNGQLSTQTPSGGLCFDIISPAPQSSLAKDSEYSVTFNAPSGCEKGKICSINCDLKFVEDETGTGISITKNVSFTWNRIGIKPTASPFAPNSNIVSYKNDTYSISFDKNIAIIDSAGPIEFRDFNTNALVFTVARENLTVRTNTLDIKPSTTNQEELLDHNHFYISIPDGMIADADDSTNTFTGSCDICQDAKFWEYYTSVDLQSIKDQWTPRGPDDPSYKALINVDIECPANQEKYCLASSSSDLSALSFSPAEQTTYLSDFPFKLQTIDQGFISGTTAMDKSDPNYFRIELKNNTPFLDNTSEVVYYMQYNYNYSTTEAYTDNKLKRLYTQKGLIVTNNDTSQSIWNIRYIYRGLLAQISSTYEKDILAAYSLRQLNSDHRIAIKVAAIPSNYNYSGRLDRISGFNEISEDIGFNADGELDENQLQNFANKHSGQPIAVVTWYDQSGKGKHLEQVQTNDYNLYVNEYREGATLSRLPVIVIDGEIIRDPVSNKPGVMFPHSNYIESITDEPLRIQLRKHKRAILGSANIFFEARDLNNYYSGVYKKLGTVFMVLVPVLDGTTGNFALGFTDNNSPYGGRWLISAGYNYDLIFEIGKGDAQAARLYKQFEVKDINPAQNLRQFTVGLDLSDQMSVTSGPNKEQNLRCVGGGNCSNPINWGDHNPSDYAKFSIGGTPQYGFRGSVSGSYARNARSNTTKYFMSEIIIYKGVLDKDEKSIIIDSQTDYYNITK